MVCTRNFVAVLPKDATVSYFVIVKQSIRIQVMHHKQIITLMALAFSICILTSLAQTGSVSKTQVAGLGVALLLIFLVCAKGSEMFARTKTNTRMLRRGRRSHETFGSGKRRKEGMRGGHPSRKAKTESFYGGGGTQMQFETMTPVQAQPIPATGSSGSRELQYFREGTDIKNAMTLQRVFNFGA